MATTRQQALLFCRWVSLPHLVSLLIPLLLIVSCPRAIAADGEGLSVDELLSYTITELNEKLQKVTGENDALSRKNAALRKRILQLRLERSRLEEQKLNSLEQSLQRTDVDDLEVREYFASDEYTQKIRDRRARLEGYQQRIEGMLKDELDRKEKLRLDIEDLKTAILELQEKRRASKAAAPSAGFLEERQTLKEKILECDNELRRQAPLVSAAETRVGTLTKQKESLLARSRQLSRDKNDLEAVLAQISQEGNRILDQQKDQVSQKDTLVRQAEEEIAGLRTYRDELTSSLQDLRVLSQDIVRQYNEQKQEQPGFLKTLAQEKQLLSAQDEVLQKRLRWGGEGASGSILEEPAGSQLYEEKTSALEGEKMVLFEKLRQVQTERKDTRERIADMKAEIVQLEGRKETALVRSRKGSSVSEAREIKNLRDMIALQTDDYQQLERQEKIVKKNVEQLRKQVGQLILSRNDLTARSQVLKEELESLKAQREQLALTLAQNQREDGSAGIQQEIEDLQVRSTLLESSLAVIKSRYDSQDWESQEFIASEQKDLEGYLSLLKQENAKLKERVLGLTVAVERLESHKAGSPSE